MVLNEIYNVAWYAADTFQYGGKTYYVDKALKKECKMIAFTHTLMVALVTVSTYLMTLNLGVESFWVSLVIIVGMLIFINFIYERLANFLIGRRLQ